MGRIIGLDVGDKTIGVSVSDPLFITAQGIKTIFRNGIKKDLEELRRIILEYEVEKAIIGLPKNMDNSLGFQGEKVMKFSEKFKREFPEIDIEFIDERLTSVSAERVLIEGEMRRNKRKKVIDKVAAVYILQMYLDKKVI
ncbi:MAG: Holliday junction resolvase RuvX [Andreesenia angusta]|nr:Holliday junction resolvase RuvX [Andreesenia angusta]